MRKRAIFVGFIMSVILVLVAMFFQGGTNSKQNGQAVGQNQFRIATTSFDFGHQRESYRTVVKAAGGVPPYTWHVSSGQLPSGLRLDTSKGEVIGAPVGGGEFPIGITVVDSKGASASRDFVLHVLEQVLDKYGGWMQVKCSLATGYFRVEKINNRWWFCTPEGHVFWMAGVFNMDHDSHVTDLGTSYDAIAKNKYGDLDMTWGPQQVRRIKSWGFNSIAEFCSGWTWPIWSCAALGCKAEWTKNGGKQPVLVPMTAQVQPSLYSLFNLNDYAPGAVKDTVYGVNRRYWKGWGSSFPDIFDPNFGAWLSGAMRQGNMMEPAGSSSWVIATITDECDELNGLCGAGPDMATNPPGYNQRNQGLVTLVTSPFQTAHPVGGLIRKIEAYSTPVVFSKEQLRDYLTKKYGGIVALNTAWGSKYSTFDSTGTEIRGETIGTGDGRTKTFTGTLAHSHVSAYSVALKVDGSFVAGDCPGWVDIPICAAAGSGAGELIGFPSGNPAVQAGAVRYESAAVTVVFTAAPPQGARISVNYIHDGWGYGSGLMDEDGRNSWIPTDPVHLGGNAKFNSDLDGFLKVLAEQYFSTVTSTIRKYAPHNLVFGPGVLGTWSAPADKNVLEAAAPYVDGIATTLDYTRAQAELSYTATHLGDKPMIIWLGAHGNADSAMWRYPDGSFRTQADRAAFYTSSVNSFLNTTNTAYNDYTVIGFRWWALQDSWGEKANWGLISLEDNPYDGQSAVVALGADPWGYPTGGEEKNYGDFLDAVRAANLQWLGTH